MLNSIRPHTLASQPTYGEVWNRMPCEEQGDFGNPPLVETVSERAGVYGVIGDRMAGSKRDVTEGSSLGKRSSVHDLPCRSEELRLGDDRASVGAKKRGNARGAKGGRKVEA
ncbi:MAG: hypothetical protein EOP84_27545 [Verrucomicrobiaceae bacterium]|nr:MAG: hypothetical protein EOP84_27545 [Verrucomicrobiaceae bacterium]